MEKVLKVSNTSKCYIVKPKLLTKLFHKLTDHRYCPLVNLKGEKLFNC